MWQQDMNKIKQYNHLLHGEITKGKCILHIVNMSVNDAQGISTT